MNSTKKSFDISQLNGIFRVIPALFFKWRLYNIQKSTSRIFRVIPFNCLLKKIVFRNNLSEYKKVKIFFFSFCNINSHQIVVLGVRNKFKYSGRVSNLNWTLSHMSCLFYRILLGCQRQNLEVCPWLSTPACPPGYAHRKHSRELALYSGIWA